MFYPQGNFYPQGTFGPQAFQGNPPFQGNPQGNFNPQGSFGSQAFQSNPGHVPFANTPYGYPQQTPAFVQGTPAFVQGLPQWSNWQHPAQQAALQQYAIQQLVAHQLAAQQPATQQPSGMNAFNGSPNGVGQSIGAWTQQPNSEQINPALTPRHHLRQQLAQYHYLVAHQLAQLAAQQAVQSSVNPYGPYAGQFMPGQLGANFAQQRDEALAM
jgi:hypothetical protein